jgi:hypothetical protein
MTTDGVIIVPSWAKFVTVTGKVYFPTQASGNGYASIHLFRNANPTPIGAGGNDLAYHNRQSYVTTNSSYTSLVAVTPKIPVIFTNESWSLPAAQTSGAAQTMGQTATEENWLAVEFFEN